jgi:hypothetical protein
MNPKAEPAPKEKLPGVVLLVTARLKKLRREHQLVEKAIRALTEIARVRSSRDRRPALSQSKLGRYRT